jgi:hypothetical protein
MSELKSKYDILIERLKGEGKVKIIDAAQKDKIVGVVEKELDDYRFENQKRIRDSQEEIATIVLTA